MKKQTTYTPYNSSWLKFGLCGLSTALALPMFRDSEMPVFWVLPMTGYYAHNLYEQYQHNNSLIKTVELKLEYEKETRIVDMKPNFVDSFTQYNALGLTFSLSLMAIQIMRHNSSADFNDYKMHTPSTYNFCLYTFLATCVFKAIHFFSADDLLPRSGENYSFTDPKTGELMSEENIIDSDFINVFPIT